MADVIKKSTNKFTKGLVMDFSPENTRNEVLTHALNATLLTFNGNELSLQNDMGNARVETAYLPDGYMPVGTCEYGGIIYIVSYNPLENKSQVGCFPSPERNVSSEELGEPKAEISREKFQVYKDGAPTGEIQNVTQHVLLKSDNLNPGDKFLICADKSIYNERLANLWVDKDPKHYNGTDKIDPQDFELISNPIIALNVVSIEDSGRIVYLNSDLRQYDVTNTHSVNGTEYTDVFRYPILGEMIEGANQLSKDDIDSYRNTLSSGYSVFKSKTSGKLAILAELLTIDSYSVTHSLQPRKTFDENGEEYTIEGSFDVIIHTEVSPEITPSNYNLVPKLQYYHLKKSQGYLQTTVNDVATTKTLFKEVDGQISKEFNSNFLNYTYLTDVYTPTVEGIFNPEKPELISTTGQFNFPKTNTYHGRMQEVEPDDDLFNSDVMSKIYTKFTEGKYHRINKTQVFPTTITKTDFEKYWIQEVQAKFYKYDPEKKGYTQVIKTEVLNEEYTYYVQSKAYEYHDAQRNEQYKGSDLYKYASEPQLAEKDHVENKLIEKFQEKEVHRYLIVDPSEYDEVDKLFIKVGDDYEEFIDVPVAGTDYYKLEVETAFVSVGYEVSADKVKDVYYYYPSKKDFIPVTSEDLEKYWNFEDYELKPSAPWGYPDILYWREEVDTYIPATDQQILNYQSSDVELFYKSDYAYVSDLNLFNDSLGQLFIVVPMDTFVANSKFDPDPAINYISGYTKPTSPHESNPNFPATGFPKDDPISLYTVADFIPQNLEENNDVTQYEDLKLANIKIPRVLSANGIDLPFKYDYTLVPCMNFGRLDHLAVSNTVDFSKLHAFNQSDFTVWKYHIDDNHLRLTFGAEVYDVYENVKVDALVLEFYDVWGFAGSLEIADKKSYSGIFTKVIPLNSLGALSNKRIEGNNYSDKYRRNINISEYKNDGTTGIAEGAEKSYYFNDNQVAWTGFSSGWKYTDGTEFSDGDNDCGTLYSNLVYGVRAYIRRPKDDGYEFIAKKEFFLYTLPIFNDYYYTVNDFSTLAEPQLDFMLTYKMQDRSSKIPYENAVITSGYNEADKAMVNEYLKGFLRATQFDITKYYKYTGETDLYLEIGLKKEYQDLNISYSPDINKFFSCNLTLVGDTNENQTFTVNMEDSAGLTPEVILGYGYDSSGKPLVTLAENSLLFEGLSQDLELSAGANSKFYKSNFINHIGNTPIPIHYNFVVGYPVSVTNITTTEIKATTVCALCHQDASGNYNYEDFSIREVLEDGKDPIYMSDNMYYNQGTLEQEMFGLCHQVQLTGKIHEQCHVKYPVETDVQPIKTAGKLNTGDPLKQVTSQIGKLTFCQPHVHGLSELNGVNIYKAKNAGSWGVAPEVGGFRVRDENMFHDDDYDDCWGIVPRMDFAENPKYNLVLNTANSIKYNSEFISTVSGGSGLIKGNTIGCDLVEGPQAEKEVDMRPFIGLSGEQLTEFNKKLIQTFKNVYVYNPDYDSLTVNVGKVNVTAKKPYFTSNLISTNSAITLPAGKTLNDYIYIGPVVFSEYLTALNKYSENADGTKIQIIDYLDDNKPLKPVRFKESLLYCGTPENYYLITNLTYNIPDPVELEDELAFKAASAIIVRKENGDMVFIDGVVNKKAFYGFNESAQKLIQLDVSNYSIESDGTLKLKSATSTSETKNLSFTVKEAEVMSDTGYEFEIDFEGVEDTTSKVKLRASMDVSAEYGLVTVLAYGPNSVIVAAQRPGYDDSYTNASYYVDINPAVIGKQDGYTYTTETSTISMKCDGVLLNSDNISLYRGNVNIPALADQDYETLHKLIEQSYQYITLKKLDGTDTPSRYPSYYYSNSPSQFVINGQTVYPGRNHADSKWGEVAMETYDYYEDPDDPYGNSNPYADDIELFEITFNSIDYNLTRKTDLKDMSSGVIKTAQTSNYSSFDRNKGYIYSINTSKYPKTFLRGTTLTINDLMYEPNVEGHRLFVKNGLCTYNNTGRAKVYYRNYNEGNHHSSWSHGDDYRYRNALYLYTGPCFDPNNL